MHRVSNADGSPLHIGIIGVGVMGEALLAGVISAGVEPTSISFVEKRKDRADEIVAKYQALSASLEEVAAHSDCLLLVVKPQDLGDLLTQIAPLVNAHTLIVSFAAGKTTSFIESFFTTTMSVIRVMPNTPTLIGKGMAAISAGSSVSESQIELVTHLLQSSGRVVTVPEVDQDAVTAVSGSGPAYFFYFVEAMISAGVELGLAPEIAHELVVQTIVGAAGMLEQSGKSPTTLRENVTSPNGTTAAAIARFNSDQLAGLIAKAMRAARDRSIELA